MPDQFMTSVMKRLEVAVAVSKETAPKELRGSRKRPKLERINMHLNIPFLIKLTGLSAECCVDH